MALPARPVPPKELSPREPDKIKPLLWQRDSYLQVGFQLLHHELEIMGKGWAESERSSTRKCKFEHFEGFIQGHRNHLEGPRSQQVHGYRASSWSHAGMMPFTHRRRVNSIMLCCEMRACVCVSQVCDIQWADWNLRRFQAEVSPYSLTDLPTSDWKAQMVLVRLMSSW